MNTGHFLIAAVLLVFPATAARAQSVEDGYVETPDHVRLYYQKTGTGRHTLILPGRLFVFKDFRQLEKQATLITYDMRNRGRSDLVIDGSKVTIQADVDDLETVRQHFGAEKFTPVGYSYLGMMVVLYAMKHPERVERIVQLGPVPLKFPTDYQPQYVQDDWEEAIGAESLKELRGLREKGYHVTHPQEYCELEWKAMRRGLLGDPSKVDRIPDVCAMPNEWPANQARHMRLHFAESVQKLDVSWEEVVAAITMPVLTIHGNRDRNAPYGAGREWAYRLANARLLTVDGAAHQSFAEAPEVVFPAIAVFLKGAWPSAAEKVAEDPRKQ